MFGEELRQGGTVNSGENYTVIVGSWRDQATSLQFLALLKGCEAPHLRDAPLKKEVAGNEKGTGMRGRQCAVPSWGLLAAAEVSGNTKASGGPTSHWWKLTGRFSRTQSWGWQEQ